jgi:hypothetical protein
MIKNFLAPGPKPRLTVPSPALQARLPGAEPGPASGGPRANYRELTEFPGIFDSLRNSRRLHKVTLWHVLARSVTYA